MSHHVEAVEVDGNDPAYNMPYSPAIRVNGGRTVYLAGVTAAPIYHSHPHVAAEFDDIPRDVGAQAELTVRNLTTVLRAAGGDLEDLVQLTRFIVDHDRNQDPINAVMARHLRGHRPATTTVEVVRLATDPRLVLELTAVAVVPQ